MLGPSSLPKIGFEVRVGELTASHDPLVANASLNTLRTELCLGGSIGTVTLDLLPFGVSPPLPGDTVEVELDAGDGLTRVFTGTVSEVSPSATGLRVLGEDGRALLARLDVEAAFEESSLADIAKDLIGRAGLEPGEIEEGPSFPSYVLHRGPRALRHLLSLAELCGLDLMVDPEGKVHLLAASEGEAEWDFVWGKDLLGLSLRREVLGPDSYEVWGEGAAGTQGAEKAHWLAVDLESVSGKAALSVEDGKVKVQADQAGDKAAQVRAGALRTGEAAKAVARQRAQAQASRPVQGHLQLGARPDIVPGAWVSVSDLPKGHAASVGLPSALRVRGVIHRLDRRSGLTTKLEL